MTSFFLLPKSLQLQLVHLLLAVNSPSSLEPKTIPPALEFLHQYYVGGYHGPCMTHAFGGDNGHTRQHKTQGQAQR